jgi:hypothetical protein
MPADLIRNYFFMKMDPEEQEKNYVAFWKPMQDRLVEKDDLTEFIRHFLMKDSSIVKQGDVYLEMKARVDPLSTSTSALVGFLKTICRFSEYYERLLHPEREPNPKLRERLERLNRIEVTTAYPFLLNLYHDLSEATLSEPQAIGILDILENFVIRRHVCNVPTNSLNKLFPALYVQAKQADSLLEGVKNVLSTKNYPRDAEFVDRFISAKLYAVGERTTRTKLILERLEASYAHMEPVKFDTLTIEHVMPQTLTPWWKDHLGDDWKDVHATWIDTIGNLTLSGYNSPLGNADFPYKRSIYEKSHLEITRYFANKEKWDVGSIRDRANFLAVQALKVWAQFAINQDEDHTVEALEPEELSEARIRDDEILSRLGGGVSQGTKTRSPIWKLSDGKVVHFKYSKHHAKGKYFWYGIRSGLIEDLEVNGTTHIVFVMGSAGLVTVPISLVKEYLASTGTTRNSDGSIKHYHVLIGSESPPALYWSQDTPRFSLEGYHTSFNE